jgi:hypothetical protein
MSLAAYWDEMVTVGLLGADRRDPPAALPGALADLDGDDPRPAPADRLLQQVAACVAVRRAGVTPAPTAPPLDLPPPDERPTTPPGAAATWQRIVDDWPILEDEWLLTVVAAGRRLAPELIEPLLVRHRGDAVRHARSMLAAGELGEWLVAQLPYLAVRSPKPANAEHVVSLPELAMPPALAVLLTAAPDVAANELAAAFEHGQVGASLRGVLTNLVARIQPTSLPAVAAALESADPSLPSIGIALALADLARLRHTMLAELGSATLDG